MIALRKIWALAKFLPYYATEVVLSNLRVAYDILTPRDHFAPAIMKIPIEPMSDLQLLMLTNLLTMTPGTLTLDVAPDRSAIYIHAMYAKDLDRFVHDFKTRFEPKIRDAF